MLHRLLAFFLCPVLASSLATGCSPPSVLPGVRCDNHPDYSPGDATCDSSVSALVCEYSSDLSEGTIAYWRSYPCPGPLGCNFTSTIGRVECDPHGVQLGQPCSPSLNFSVDVCTSRVVARPYGDATVMLTCLGEHRWAESYCPVDLQCRQGPLEDECK